MRRTKLAGTRKGRKSSFGCVFKLQRRDGSEYEVWSARWFQGGRRVQRGGFATKDAAEDFLARQRIERSEGRALGLTELRRIPTKDAIDLYLAWSKEHRRPRTHKSNATFLNGLAGKLGQRDVLSLTGDDVVRALEALGRERGWKPATLHCGLTTAGAVFRWFVQERYAREGVLRGARRRLPRIDVESPPYLSPEEIRMVYAAVPEEIRAPVVLMGECGLRRDEATYLRHDEVARDLASVTIRGERSKGHRARTVPLPPVLALDWAEYAAAREARRPASPESLRAEVQSLVEELAPTPETRAAIGVKLAACGESARDLARLVNLLREKVASKDNETGAPPAAQEAA